MDQAHGEPCFVGDAIADPVTGVHLAFALKALMSQGGGAVIDLSMRDVVRYAMGELPDDLLATAYKWQTIADQNESLMYKLRQPLGDTRALGADNSKWL